MKYEPCTMGAMVAYFPPTLNWLGHSLGSAWPWGPSHQWHTNPSWPFPPFLCSQPFQRGGKTESLLTQLIGGWLGGEAGMGWPGSCWDWCTSIEEGPQHQFGVGDGKWVVPQFIHMNMKSSCLAIKHLGIS